MHELSYGQNKVVMFKGNYVEGVLPLTAVRGGTHVTVIEYQCNLHLFL